MLPTDIMSYDHSCLELKKKPNISDKVYCKIGGTYWNSIPARNIESLPWLRVMRWLTHKSLAIIISQIPQLINNHLFTNRLYHPLVAEACLKLDHIYLFLKPSTKVSKRFPFRWSYVYKNWIPLNLFEYCIKYSFSQPIQKSWNITVRIF